MGFVRTIKIVPEWVILFGKGLLLKAITNLVNTIVVNATTKAEQTADHGG